MTEASDRVTVIVTTRNSSSTLNACLASIRGQAHSSLELVVVDNGSTDGTVEISQRYADLVLEAGPERSAQRNRGVERATGAFVLIVDSDMVLSPGVVASCVAAAHASDAVGVIVPERSVGEGFWAKCKALERSCYVGDDTIEAPRFFVRDAYLRYGGYDEAITGPEDWDLPARMRANERFARITDEIVHLEGRPTIAGLMRKKYYYGRGAGAYLRRHPELARRQLVLLRPAYVRHWRRLLRRPALSAGMVVMKLCEYAAGATGLASARLGRGGG
jgi:glycosyltransferase involved in cell wall biosynthesis